MELPDKEILLLSASDYLRDIGEYEVTTILRSCNIEYGPPQEYIGSGPLGLRITLRCNPDILEELREFHEIIGDYLPSEKMTIIKTAIEAVLPVEFKVHDISARARLSKIMNSKTSKLIQEIQAQKNIMIAVATGGPRIQDKNDEYQQRQLWIKSELSKHKIDDPNPFNDLWDWYGRWRAGDLPTYQSRREFVSEMYQPLLARLTSGVLTQPFEPNHAPTGWGKVDRGIRAIIQRIETAQNEEDFQTVGLLCREVLISLAQCVYDPSIHKTEDGVVPSQTDANRMLGTYLSHELTGSSDEAARRHAKAALTLANDLQHRRTAKFKEAALCAEATRTVINIVYIISEKRNKLT
jgi:hypothetical protein